MLRLVFLHELPDFHEDFQIVCFFSFSLQGKLVCLQSTLITSCKVAVNYSVQCRRAMEEINTLHGYTLASILFSLMLYLFHFVLWVVAHQVCDS
jgi:hypothetical protein